MPDAMFQILHYLKGRAICNKMTEKLKPSQTNKQAQGLSNIHSFYISIIKYNSLMVFKFEHWMWNSVKNTQNMILSF